jgi:hypothetical protein
MADASDVKRILEVVATGVGALEEIVRIGRGVLASTRTSDEIVGILSALVAVAETVIGGLSDDSVVTVDMIKSALTELQGTLATNDQAAKADIDARFPQ